MIIPRLEFCKVEEKLLKRNEQSDQMMMFTRLSI